MTPLKSVIAYAICLQRKPPSQQAIASWKKTFDKVVIVNAIDANTLDVQNDPRIHEMVRSQLKNPDIAADSVFALPSKGAVGCALSHYGLMRKCERMNKPIVVIEQDVVFTDDATRTIRALSVPKIADFVSLLYLRQPNVFPFSESFNRIVGPHCDGAQCYYLHPRGASKILNKAFPIVTQNDLMIGVVSNTDPSFVALALNKRLYPLLQVFVDNLNSSVQSFRIKKYLPRENWIYYVVIAIFVLLSCACLL